MSSTNLFINNTPSKIRGGKGALMPQEDMLRGKIILLRPDGHLPYLRGGVDNQHYIFIKLTLNNVVISFLWISYEPIKGVPQFIRSIDDIIHHEGSGFRTDDVVNASLVEIEATLKAFAVFIIVLC